MSPKDSEDSRNKRFIEAHKRLHADVAAKFPHLRGEALLAAEATIMLESLRAAVAQLFGPEEAQRAVDEAIRQMQERRRQ